MACEINDSAILAMRLEGKYELMWISHTVGQKLITRNSYFDYDASKFVKRRCQYTCQYREYLPLLRKKSDLDGLTMTNLQTYCKNQLKAFLEPTVFVEFFLRR